MKRTMKVKVATTIAVVLGVAGAGAGYAFWTADGSGSGTAASATAQSVTVNAVTGTADLYPGFNDGDVYFTLTNPNPYPVAFTAMSSGAVVSSNTTACPSVNVTVDATASSLVGLVVAGGATSGTLSIPNVVNMLASAPDGCQTKTFSIPLTLTGSQV